MSKEKSPSSSLLASGNWDAATKLYEGLFEEQKGYSIDELKIRVSSFKDLHWRIYQKSIIANDYDQECLGFMHLQLCSIVAQFLEVENVSTDDVKKLIFSLIASAKHLSENCTKLIGSSENE